jgi:hypothetical protein
MKAKAFLGCFILLFAACQTHAATQPAIGDAWVYSTTYRALYDPIRKPTTSTVFTTVAYLNRMGKLVFSGTMAGFGMYSNTCLFDVAAGEELAGEVACDESLPVGKSWRAALRDPTKSTEESLTVTGTEEFKIGSQVYLATVIRTERALTSWDYLGRRPDLTRRRADYWYVPEIKGMVKIVHELLDDHGQVLTRESYELLHFYPASKRSAE